VRRHRRGAGFVLAAAAWLVLALPTAAQDNPDTGRGFQADKVYQLGQLDTVNLFNGNLTLVLPLGNSYPVNGNLSYGLTLTYNSNIWRFNDYQWWQPDGGIISSRVASLEKTNAGPGWRLTLGELQDPALPENDGSQWVYVAQDGARHAFYDTLHLGETNESGVLYTRDGSYLRLVRESGTAYRVELPDGSLHRFSRASSSSSSPFHLDSIADAFGNTLTVTYPSALQWHLSDGHRSHDVYLKDLGIDGETWKVVDRVELAAFGGTTATYGFHYAYHSIEESGYDDYPAAGSEHRNAYLLTSVGLPDGSSWRMTYYKENTEGEDEDLSSSDNQGGVLQELTLPTLGSYDWTYQDYEFPSRVAPGAPGTGTLSLAKSTGVRRKRMRNAAGVCESFGSAGSATDPEVGCEWHYAWDRQLGIFQRSTIVTSPAGHQAVSYFDVHPRPNTTDWSGWEYGLPFTLASDDGQGRYLSQQIYDGTVADGELVREVYVTYERDRVSNSSPSPEYWENSNRRMRARREVYLDDLNGSTPRERTQAWSDFDGLGHYRSMQAAGTLPGGGTRTMLTEYNDGNGSYTINLSNNSVSGGYTPWPSASPWVLGTFTETRVTEGTETAVEQFCFDASTGFLQRQRSLAGSTPGTHDVLRVATASAAGNVARQRWFGGDGDTLGTGSDLCNLTLPSTDTYSQRHGYAYGARSSSSWRTATDAVFLETLNRTVDASTGLPSRDTDVSDLYVDYTYDASGRPTLEKPQTGQGGRTQYVYTRAVSSSNLAHVEVKRQSNNGSTVLAQRRVYLDAFGRPWRDQRQEADGQWSSVDTVYSAPGWKRSVSERQTGFPDSLTVFQDYDPFGRPGRVVPPDDPAHRALFWYTGERVMQRETLICGNAAGCASPSQETKHQVTERYDRHGRLYQVIEPSGAGGANVTTNYSYDIGNRLSRASTSAGVNQTRLFDYDQRGFLLSERHPEKGATGNGYVTYSGYDPLGNVGKKVDGPFDLRYFYDRAGRLVRVNEQVGTVQRPMKVFQYADSNDGADKRNGKLQWADRYNYVSLNGTAFTVRVRETYEYAGVGGSPSKRDTQMWVAGVARESFTQGFAWNDLGDLSSLDYPKCTHAACTAGVDHTVTFGYTHGFLTSVPGFGSVSYHANGMVHQVTHPNGVVDTLALDASGMARPRSISTSGATSDWASGTYRYDGAGNITQIGSSRFAYDGVSRLVAAEVSLEQDDGCSGDTVLANQTLTGPSAQTFESCATLQAGPNLTVASSADITLRAADRVVFTSGFTVHAGARLTADIDATISDDGGGGGETTSRTYTYDAFGNLTYIAGDGGRSIPINAATNRSSAPTSSYDAAGNMTAWNGRSFDYDAFGMMWRQSRPTSVPNEPDGLEEWLYFYTADDERFWSYHKSGSDWTIRDLDGNVLRHYHSDAGGWTIEREYVYRDGQLLAGIEPGVNTWHYSLDYLGSPRLITGNAAFQRAFHVYYPYGEEATAWNQDSERMKFTAHERDFTDPGGPGDDLDYMHARYCNPVLGRFMSVDPSPGSINSRLPQSWNRYGYALSNPLKFVDPTGAIIEYADANAEKTYTEYKNNLDEDSEDYANLLQLEDSDITYVVNIEDLGNSNEGSITSDGARVFINIDPTQASGKSSRASRFAHEFQHGVQVDNGMLGFAEGKKGKWQVIFADIYDEVDAWTAQLRQAQKGDLGKGKLRNFKSAGNKAKFLLSHGYNQYRGKKSGRERISAPRTVPGYSPGQVVRNGSIFYRIPR